MIQLLDTDTINKIAAGEVIERPESVVKELTENAIDAGATRISIEIRDGGLSFIRVSDNGFGIDKEDIRNAFKKHATSKISSADDLEGVGTLGFRGEALSSIAAVAKVSLLTKTKRSLTGYSYQINAGEEISFEESGLPEGTTVIVKNLFFNTPVRKKFLKSAQAEAAMTATLIERMALSNPFVSFSFISNGKEKLSTTGNGNLKEVIYSIYGREIAGNLIEVCEEGENIKIGGFIGKPAISRGNRSFENYAVNGRFIKNDSISASIEEAYKGYIMLHNFPFSALLFEIKPELLDVNVHPAKRELRLSASESVCSFITDTLRKKIEGSDIVPDVVPGKEDRLEAETTADASTGSADASTGSADAEVPADTLEPSSHRSAPLFKKYEFTPTPVQTKTEPSFEGIEATSASGILKDEDYYDIKESASPLRADLNKSLQRQASAFEAETKYNCEQQEIESVRETNKYRLLGHLFATYWLIEADDTFYMMDQHAAHEKILYERLMTRVRLKKPQTQYLTVPILIECSDVTADLLESDSDIYSCFTDLGYELEPFGDRSLKVTGIPAGLPAMDYRQMLTDMLDLLEDKLERGVSLKDSPQIMVEKIASMSCKAAIKGNDRISGLEAIALMEEMMDAENPFNCPHGRPTLIAMSKYEIEKKFKRIV